MPALSQRLSGRGVPDRMIQGRDTGCLSSTRTVEALLAICGGTAGRGDGVGTLASCGNQGPHSPLSPPHRTQRGIRIGDPQGSNGTLLGAHYPESRGSDAPLGESGCGHSCPKGRAAMGASLGGPVSPPNPSSPDPAANHVQSRGGGPPPGPSQRHFELHRYTGPGLRGPHLRGRKRQTQLSEHILPLAPTGSSSPGANSALGTAWPYRGQIGRLGWQGGEG